MTTSKTILALGLGVAVSIFATGALQAQPADLEPDAQVILVANGCGPGWYRGPGGACHRFGRGPYPGGYYGPRWNGCPPGYWRGPWGHCRNTPYHGRLPGGGWK